MRAQISHGGGLIQLVPSASTRCAWITAVEGSPVDIAWLANDGARWPAADVETMLNIKEKREIETSKGNSMKETSAMTTLAPGIEDEDEASVAENDVTEHDVDFHNIFNLLYPPQAVRTQVQKRTQILLLKDVCRRVRLFFNTKFESLCCNKEDVMAAIQTLNVRIREILLELQLVEDVFEPAVADEEARSAAITIRDNELVNVPYVSEAMTKKRCEEDEERRARELANAGDDSKGRALVDMMNGTLEVKRDVFAEASALQKPAWMDETVPELLSEVQRKEVEEYEAQYKALQEEQSKYRKSLEIELKRLKSDVKDLWRNFDEKVDKLAKTRILTERELLSHELYISRIALGMASQDQLHKQLNQINESVADAERALKEKHDTTSKFAETVQSAKEAMMHVIEEEKGLVKTFPRDIKLKCDFNFDPETIKMLFNFFKFRSNAEHEDGGNDMEATGSEVNTFTQSNSKKGNSQRTSRSMRTSRTSKRGNKGNRSSQQGKSRNPNNASKAGASAKASQGANGAVRLGPMQEAALAMKEAQEELPSTTPKDPFFLTILKQERDARHAKQTQPSLESLDIPDDLQVDQYYWSKLNELRTAHIQKQIEAISCTLSYNTIKKRLDELLNEETFLDDNVSILRNTRDELLRHIVKSEKDIQCLVALRQGQDEVDKDVVVTDYSSSALIPVAVVNKYNARINELGRDMIGVLTRIKHFRRKINLLNWEAKHTELESRHLEEYLTDLQLFRVTRNMQQLIRDGEGATVRKIVLYNKLRYYINRPHVIQEKLEKTAPSKRETTSVFKDGKYRLEKLAKGNKALKRLVRSRAEENDQLQKRIEDLSAQIDERKSVLKSRCDARGEDANPSITVMKRMKKVVMRRRLIDMTSLQAQEMSYLQQELEKMRDRTFPSFVKAFRSRMHTNPDDKSDGM